MVMKSSNIIQYAIHNRDANRGLHKFDIVYKIDGLIYTLAETVKELENTL
jgi:hypothetical protein